MLAGTWVEKAAETEVLVCSDVDIPPVFEPRSSLPICDARRRSCSSERSGCGEGEEGKVTLLLGLEDE